MKRQMGNNGKNGARPQKGRVLGASTNVRGTARRRMRQKPKNDEAIYIKAATYCLRHFPTLWTVGSVCKENDKHTWRITVVLRYPTGHEGEIGELRFDGKRFATITPRSVMEERAGKLAADPALQQAWNEYTGSALPARKF